MRASAYSVVGGRSSYPDVSVRHSLDRRQSTQLVAGVGDELPHPQIGIDAMRQRTVDVVQQAIQRVPDDSDLVVIRVGIPGRTRTLIW